MDVAIDIWRRAWRMDFVKYLAAQSSTAREAKMARKTATVYAVAATVLLVVLLSSRRYYTYHTYWTIL